MWVSCDFSLLQSLAVHQPGEGLRPGHGRAGPGEDLQVSPPSVWIQPAQAWRLVLVSGVRVCVTEATRAAGGKTHTSAPFPRVVLDIFYIFICGVPHRTKVLFETVLIKSFRTVYCLTFKWPTPRRESSVHWMDAFFVQAAKAEHDW